MRPRLCLFLAAGAAALGGLAYLGFAGGRDDPGGDRAKPIVIEPRKRPARDRGDPTPPGRDRHPGFGPAAPVAPKSPDEDDVSKDDAAGDVRADD